MLGIFVDIENELTDIGNEIAQKSGLLAVGIGSTS